MVAFEQMHVADSQWYNTLQLSRTVSAKTVLFADEKPISYSLIVNLMYFCLLPQPPPGEESRCSFWDEAADGLFV